MDMQGTHRRATPNHGWRLGFTLIELLATLAIVSTLVLAIAPAIGELRVQSRVANSTANLQAISQARGMYAKANKDRIYTYSWQAGETYVMPDGRTRTPSSTIDAALWQNAEVLMRRTGRINGQTKIRKVSSTIPHRRFAHLVLMDFMAGDDDTAFPNAQFIDPDDQQLLTWQEHPLDYLEEYGGLPYAQGSVSPGYHQSQSLGVIGIQQRWSFGTSYFSVPFAWQGDGPNNVYVPISATPHLFNARNLPDLSGRSMSEVRFPSSKVHLFEEFDREQSHHPYFAYDHAAPEKLMFDGSINTQISGQANSSVSPEDAGQGILWTQQYVPLDTFPIPLGGLGDNDRLDMRYMWTELGLQGVDYAP